MNQHSAGRSGVTKRPLRLLHASDCHLGAYSQPGAHEEAFVELLEAAGRWDVDAVLLAGDIFDHSRVTDKTLAWTADQLAEVSRPTVILPGNHDAWGPSSVYQRFDFEERCSQVHVLRRPNGQTVYLSELDLAVWGRPVVNHVSSFRPLASVPPRPKVGWSIAMGHGLVVDKDEATTRGSPIFPADLEAIDWDYVALGHWPSFWLVRSGRSPVCYAGPTADHHNWPSGTVLVDLAPGLDTVVRRIPFATVELPPIGTTLHYEDVPN